MVWHNLEADGVHTDVYFARYGTLNASLSAPVHIGNTPANDGRDQWNPALDPDANGNYLVTWYDRKNDPNDITYQVYSTKVTATGTPIDTVDTMTYDARAVANTDALPLTGANPLAGEPGWRLLGEYQGVWEWYGTWYTATTYITPSGYQDIFMPQVQP